MARISLKNLRNMISESDIPGKFVRGKIVLTQYLLIAYTEDGYRVCTYEENDGYRTAQLSPVISTLDEALREYSETEQKLLSYIDYRWGR